MGEDIGLGSPRKSPWAKLSVIFVVLAGVAIVFALANTNTMHMVSPPASTTAPAPEQPSLSTAVQNTPPTANNQSVTTSQNTSIDITLSGTDPDQNDTLTAEVVSPPSHGTLGTINQDTGVVTYTPNRDFTGSDSFTFKVNDGKVDSGNVGTVNIAVNG